MCGHLYLIDYFWTLSGCNLNVPAACFVTNKEIRRRKMQNFSDIKDK